MSASHAGPQFDVQFASRPDDGSERELRRFATAHHHFDGRPGYSMALTRARNSRLDWNFSSVRVSVSIASTGLSEIRLRRI